MVKLIRREVRQRGVGGWVFLVIFWMFNALMAFGMWVTLRSGGTERDTAQAAVIGMGILLVIWAMGSVVTGALAYFTRGPKTIIEETVDG